jgi:gentisate 1,2-dioxygenase
MSTAANLMPSALETASARRARYWSAANNFRPGQPVVPGHVFVAERDRAIDERTGTALIPLDLSDRLGLAYPATVPNLLARYVRVAAGDEIACELASSGEAYYVMEGGGEVEKGDERFAWGAGDVFVLPGAGGATRIRAGAGGALLWMVTDEPVLSYFGIERSPLFGDAGAVHYPAEATEAEMALIHQRVDDGKQSGKAVLFTRADLEATHLATPTVAFAYNSLPPEDDQPPHRHNAAALTLCVQGEGVYSMVDGRKVDWMDRAVMVTPPSALHSHHNRGPEMMYSVVAQDGGVFYNARTLGYASS